MRRVLVLGNCGSGKTTFARRLSRAMGAPHTELDSIFHLENWTSIAPEEFARIVTERAAGETWVIEGGYKAVRPLILARADAIVWLDLPFWIIGPRLWVRTFSRMVKGTVLWNGNREGVRNVLFNRDGILYWQIKVHAKRKREFSALLTEASARGVATFRLRSPGEVESWLAERE